MRKTCPTHKGTVLSVNISTQKGTIKTPVKSANVTERGIEGDAHAGQSHRQVSLLSQESIDRFSTRVGREFAPGEFAENITTRGIDLSQVALLDQLGVGETRLEVTQIGKACHPDGCAIFKQVGQCVMPKDGIFCRVLHGGRIEPGDTIRYYPRGLTSRVITLSDRASRGEYEDKSGPLVTVILNSFFGPKRWRLEIEGYVLPDDPDKLRDHLERARQDKVDVIITTGGTGLGPHDITPDVVAPLCDKLIPGIMEHIRLRYGQDKPNALLSRSIAGVMGQTLIYTLPGSVRAVEEYMTEILKTLEHLILTVHGIDPHTPD